MSLQVTFPFMGFTATDGFLTIQEVISMKRRPETEVEIEPVTDPPTYETATSKEYEVRLLVAKYKDQTVYEAKGEPLEVKTEVFTLSPDDPIVAAMMGALYGALKTVPGLENAVDV